MVKAAVIGVSGYGGGELTRLLSRHPDIEMVYAGSETYAGKPLAQAFPALYGTKVGALICQSGDALGAAETADVVFLAQENGAAMKSVPAILETGKKIVDLSADFRLKDATLYPQWYKLEHVAPKMLTETAVYGLPELHKEAIQRASLVANPGCHTTASILALAPLVAKGLVRTSGIVVDSKTGVSGAGRSKNDLIYKYAEANESAKPYQVGGLHRHIPEIEQELSGAAGSTVTVAFTPHLVPMTRGILATTYAQLLDSDTKAAQLTQLFTEFYAAAPFVVVREPGDHPATKDTCGANYCHLSIAVDTRTGMVIVNSALDNLVKGAAGQAVQNMNLMLGLPETAGLEGGGLWP